MLRTVLRRWPGVVLVLCGFVVLYYGALNILKSCMALCPRVSSFLLTLGQPCLGKSELVYVLLVHLFVCFARASFLSFFSSLGFGDWLRLVIVTLLDFSIIFFVSISPAMDNKMR